MGMICYYLYAIASSTTFGRDNAMKPRLFLLFILLLSMGLPLASMAAVNINTADAATLAAELPGIGPKKAQAIIEYRQQNGKFGSVDELTKVPGIGTKTVDNLRKLITTDGSAGTKSAKDDNKSEKKGEKPAPKGDTASGKPK